MIRPTPDSIALTVRAITVTPPPPFTVYRYRARPLNDSLYPSDKTDNAINRQQSSPLIIICGLDNVKARSMLTPDTFDYILN